MGTIRIADKGEVCEYLTHDELASKIDVFRGRSLGHRLQAEPRRRLVIRQARSVIPRLGLQGAIQAEDRDLDEATQHRERWVGRG